MIKLRPANRDIVEIPLGEGDNRVPLPRGAQVLEASRDERGGILVTVACNQEQRKFDERRFVVMPHGIAAPHTLGVLTYIGSPRLSIGALHVFEINSPERTPGIGIGHGIARNEGVNVSNTGAAVAGAAGAAISGVMIK